MSKKRNALVVIIFSLLITSLFHNQALGLNLLISETLFITWILITKQFNFRELYPLTLGLGLIITAISTVITFSVFSNIINFLVLFLFVGLLIYPATNSIFNIFGQACSNIFNSQIQFIKDLSASKFNGHNLGSYIWKSRIFMIPIFIILLFIIIYRLSNPVFDDLVGDIEMFLYEKGSFLFEDFNFSLIITLMISLFVSIFIFIRTSNQRLIEIDKNSSEELERKKKRISKYFRSNALTNEFKAGVFLLIVLNMVILVLNIIDIRWVWFGFEWEGEFLKQFVHEGTYLLIFSIIISIILVLYFFRGNLNFYKKNRLLKYLSYIWLVQNGILALSVAIRNFWYINHFALAYKRIGVIIFLILTVYGLYTVYVKVWQRKSVFYLFKTNSYALLLILIIGSIINWDTFIAKYNFKNSDKSFLHLDYVATLSDKTLPYLDKSLHELNKIDLIQKEKFPFKQNFMTPEEYYQIIGERKNIFRENWESKSLLSWNLPEYIAYNKLFEDK